MKILEVERLSGCKYQGIIFDDGVVVIHWITGGCPSITTFPDFQSFEQIYLRPGVNRSVIISPEITNHGRC